MLHHLDHTDDSPAANIAVDEALLESVEDSTAENPIEVLRLWQPTAPFVVIGRASILKEEVNEQECERRGIPILRRSSGGTAIITGPGCLMYAVILSLRIRPELRMIDAAHRFVLERTAKAIRACGLDAQCAGTSDVTVGGKKFSGNSLRTRRESLLYHGTILLDFDMKLMQCLSKNPPRQPDYREGRAHTDFLQNLHLPPEQIKRALKESWHANEPLAHWPTHRVNELIEERFGQPHWTKQR
jgi:lipoate---protein ligase